MSRCFLGDRGNFMFVGVFFVVFFNSSSYVFGCTLCFPCLNGLDSSQRGCFESSAAFFVFRGATSCGVMALSPGSFVVGRTSVPIQIYFHTSTTTCELVHEFSL